MELDIDPEDLNRRREEFERKIDAVREELKLSSEEFEELLDSHQRFEEGQRSEEMDPLTNPYLMAAVEQAVNRGTQDGLAFPIVLIMVSRMGQVWAMEIKNGTDGLEQDKLCSNLLGRPIGMPLVLYLSDSNGKTFQAEIVPDTRGAQA
jgi:hypothetical protein